MCKSREIKLNSSIGGPSLSELFHQVIAIDRNIINTA